MPITRLESKLETASALGLTEHECKSVEREAFRLMVLGRAICVVWECDKSRGTYIDIYCEQRRAHIVGRCHPTYYVLDPDLKPLVVSRDFGRVLEMVNALG